MEEAESMLKKTIEKYENKASEFAEWLAHEIQKGLTVFILFRISLWSDANKMTVNGVCSIRHDFYGGCRDSAEGGRFCHA